MIDFVLGLFGSGGGVALPDHATVSQWLLRAGVALAIAAIGWWLSKLLARAVERGLLRVGVDQILRDFLRGLVHAIGIVVVAVAALDVVGVPTTSLLAVLGAAGLAIGLALKDSLSNIASGVMLIVLRPFRSGDLVLIGGHEGVVEHVRIFQTTLRTPQNHFVYLPNSQITTGPIVNYTAKPQRRLDVAVNVGYDADLGRVRSLLLGLATANPRVLAEPPPEVVVNALADHAVSMHLHAWVPSAEVPAARGELLEAVREQFAGAEIPLFLPRREIAVLADSSVAKG